LDTLIFAMRMGPSWNGAFLGRRVKRNILAL
jgi:hypothetical protein